MTGGEKTCVVDNLIMLAPWAGEHTDRSVSVFRGALSALLKKRKDWRDIRNN